jgi:tyrosine-protein kinase Etk/Wzc
MKRSYSPRPNVSANRTAANALSDKPIMLPEPQEQRRRSDRFVSPRDGPVILPEDGVNVGEQLAMIADGKYLIAGIWSIVMLLAGSYLLVVPPTYEADSLLRVDKNKGFLADPLRGEPRDADESSNPRAQREGEILRSRSVLSKVVDDLDLPVEVAPHYFPLVGEAIARRRDVTKGPASPWLGLEQYAWGGESIELTKLAVPDDYLGESLTLIALGEGRYRILGPEQEVLGEGRVGVAEDMSIAGGRSLSLLVSELKARPGTYFDIKRNRQLSTVEALDKALTVQETAKDTDVISVGLKGRDPGLTSRIINDIVDTYVRRTITWESAEAKQKLSFLEQQLPVIKERLARAEEALNTFRQANQAVDLTAENDVLLKQIADLEIQASQLRQKREKFGAEHPRVVTLNAQIGQVDQALSGLNARVKGLPRNQKEMLGLSRAVQVNSELYVSLLNSVQEQRVAAAGTIGNVRIVDYAVVPEEPSWPKPSLVLAIAVVFGLLSGLAAVFLRQTLRRSVGNPFEIENHLRLPVYAMVPHSKQQNRLAHLSRGTTLKKPAVLADLHPDDISVESLRSLRTMLYTALADASNNVLLICSPTAGSGKSFISLNLAAVLASAGKRVLLVDADLRKGRLHEWLVLPSYRGLSDLAADLTWAGEVVSRTRITGIDFIAKGRTVSHPSELLMARTVEAAFSSFERHYDHIIIDSPPVLGVPDAAIIGRLAGAAIMVIKEEIHTLREIELSVKRLQQAGINPRGFLINDIRRVKNHYPNYGYGYSS